jgi:3D-(3,5/4)-trihydroxycyclohexane-1,2-dione acylhydrolase (decyclizing)
MKTIRLTAAQAMTRFLSVQMTEIDGTQQPIFAGVWAIFGHGNVAGLGEALYATRDTLPTYRAHNEQGMAHAAVAFAKASRRRRMMVCTTSIGPGAVNMVTAAAVAHVNRLPVLLIPGDVFANRGPDPVLQQVESFGDGTVSANDCFKPVSRYFDRITRPEQIIPALNRAMSVLTDPVECGPVTLAFCQDVQAEAYDYPESFFERRIHRQRRQAPDTYELTQAVKLLKSAQRPFIISGGGVLHSEAELELQAFAEHYGIPVAETQAGKSSMAQGSKMALGALGVTGTGAANVCAEQADVILAIGTRLADFTTGSWGLFKGENRKIIGLNVQPFDATKHRAHPLVADAKAGLSALNGALAGWSAPASWSKMAEIEKAKWLEVAATYTAPTNAELPSDAQVIGAIQRNALASDVVVGAAGGLPGEMHKLWQAGAPGGYHFEYGFSTMGYEIAGALGVKLADPSREVICMVGDGSYMMMNSELATAVMMDLKIILILPDNRGFGCINRLQAGTGGAPFNNLLKDSYQVVTPTIDFAAHARALGADAVKVASIADLETAFVQARAAKNSQVIVIETDPNMSTDAGGHWWDVAVPQVSNRETVTTARKNYEQALKAQHIGD